MPHLPPWLQVPVRVIRRSFGGMVTINAGGIALFALLATVPTLAAVVSIYGLVANPAEIEGQLGALYRVFPRAVVDFMVTQLERAAQSSTSQLSTTLVTSIVFAIISARGATNAVIDGLNTSYGLIEERGTIRRFLTSLVVSAAALIAILLVVAIVVLFPTTAALVELGGAATWVAFVRWPLIVVGVTAILVALYRTGPSGGIRTPRRLLPGAIAGTLLWLVASFGLSLWVDRVADYQALYGAFAGAIVTLLWFYVSALSVLIGASVNAELGPSGHRHKWRQSAGKKGLGGIPGAPTAAVDEDAPPRPETYSDSG
jgi:membrane protein